MTTNFPTAPRAYGLNGPSADVTVEKSIHASHTEILTPPEKRVFRSAINQRGSLWNSSASHMNQAFWKAYFVGPAKVW